MKNSFHKSVLWLFLIALSTLNGNSQCNTFVNCPAAPITGIISPAMGSCAPVTIPTISPRNCGFASYSATAKQGGQVIDVGLFTSSPCFPLGTTNVTYQAVDSNNVVKATCRFDVIISAKTDPCNPDEEAPKFPNCPTAPIVKTQTGACTDVKWAAIIPTDNCGAPSLSVTTSDFIDGLYGGGVDYLNGPSTVGGCFKVGTTYLSYTARDAQNLTSTCNVTVIINPTPVTVLNPCKTDTIPPKFNNCPASPIKVLQTGTCASAQWTTPTASDNCYIPFVTVTTSPTIQNITSNGDGTSGGFCFPIGKTTVTYTAQDNSANTRTDTCRFDVIVTKCTVDSLPPVLDFCPNNRTVETAIGTTCATATWSTPDMTDNCTAPTLTVVSSPTTGLKSGSCFPIGTTTVTYTATRANNLKTTCRFTVTVKAVATPQSDACANDVTPPTFANCPTDIRMSGGSGGHTISWIEPTASDNCVTPKVTFTTASPYIGTGGFNGSYFTPGTGATMIYTATDAKGLTAKCSFIVSVSQGKTSSCPPVSPFEFLYCPTNRLVEIPSSTCAVVNWVEPIRPHYRCGSVILDYTTNPTPNLQNGSCFPIGSTAVTYSIKTGGPSCRFVVTVKATSNTCNLTPSVSGNSSINIGATTNLTGSATTGTAVWKSSDSTIATVSATGVVKGLKTGLVVIVYRVTEGNCTEIASKTITVGTPPSDFDATKCYRLIARHSGKVAEIAEHSALNGVNIQQGTWGYSRRQVWRIKSIDGTYYQVMNGYSGEVMDVKGNFMYSGANIQQGVKNGGDNQKWRFDKNTEGYYFITAKHSGMVVDVKGVSTADGANIQQSTKNGGQNQQWTVSTIGCPAGTAAAQSAQIYAADGYREGQKSIITWVSNATNADYFTVEKLNTKGEFAPLSTVNAKPLADFSANNYYSLTDNETVEGDNIYRIGLVADNTPPQYSNLISLNFKAAMDFSLYPNPTSDYVDVDLTTYESRPVTLTLIDVSGKEARLMNIEKAAKLQRVELDGLPTGQYVLRIQTVGKRDVTRLLNITK